MVFSFLGLPPDPALGPLQVTDGPALGVLAYRSDDAMQMDWWYDVRRLDLCTVEELAAQFRLGLIGLTSEASADRRRRLTRRTDGDARIVVIGVDPAITGEPSEERRRLRPGSVEPNGRARHSLQ